MLIDNLNTFCNGTSVAGDAGTALLGNVIDLQQAGRNLGVGETMRLLVRVTTEVITGGTAGTILFKLVSDAQEAIAVDGSATVHLTSATLVTDDAAANSAALNAGGTIFDVELPSGTYERYLGIIATIGTTTVTAGAIDAMLVADSGYQHAYPDGLA